MRFMHLLAIFAMLAVLAAPVTTCYPLYLVCLRML